MRDLHVLLPQPGHVESDAQTLLALPDAASPEYTLVMILKGGSCGAGRGRGKRDLQMSAIAAIDRSQALGGNSEVERLSASRRYK